MRHKAYYYVDKHPVSIHASVKDATPSISRCMDAIPGFNPRICKRCDFLHFLQNIFIVSFNPRICKRCDGDCKVDLTSVTVSIHASVKDATFLHFLQNIFIVSFNPRICKRCDLALYFIFILFMMFQSTHL